jgi:hypothetical protein
VIAEGDCYVDHYLRGLTVSQRRVMVAASGETADEWHPLLRDLLRCSVLDLARIIEGEEALFEALAEAPANADLAELDRYVDLPDPDADDGA